MVIFTGKSADFSLWSTIGSKHKLFARHPVTRLQLSFALSTHIYMQVQLYVTWDNIRLTLPTRCAVCSSPLVSDSSKHIEGISLVVRNIVGTYHDSIRYSHHSGINWHCRKPEKRLMCVNI